jgi:OPA family sugar phosphate sensor protein UhpC-like MFS transporter
VCFCGEFVKVLELFKPAPYLEEMGDSQKIDAQYKYWRWRTFYSMYIGYVFYYFTRKSFTFAMPAMQAELGLSKIELGLLGTLFSLIYGASKFLSGIMGDKSNPRYFMSIGLILTGICNIFFGATSFWMGFAILWALNGWFQGWGWPGCAKLLTHWYSHSERGRWWSFWNTSHNLGGALIPMVVAFFAKEYGWRSAMYFPGVVCILIGFFLINRLRDTPQSLGLPSIEAYRSDYPTKSREVEKSSLSVKEILWGYVLRNKYLWMLGFAYFFIYIIRTAINDWSMFYLIEVKKYDTFISGVCMFAFEIGGLFGNLVAGWSSDVIFKGKRTPVNVIFTVTILFVLYGFKVFVAPVPIMDAGFMFLFGFFIFGPQLLIGMAAVEVSHKKAAATSNGFVSCFAYIGAAIAGGPLAAVAELWGWESYLLILGGCAISAVILLLPLWSVKTGNQEGAVRAS